MKKAATSKYRARARASRQLCLVGVDESSVAPVSAYEVRKVASLWLGVEPTSIEVELAVNPLCPDFWVRWVGKPGNVMLPTAIKLQHRKARGKWQVLL